MPGGARVNAGRKPAPNMHKISTSDRIQRRQAKWDPAIMPAEMLLVHARYHHKQWGEETQKPKDQQEPETIKLHGQRVLDFATAAAPYYHPKLAALAVNPGAAGNLTLEQILRASFPDAAPAAKPEDGPVMIEAQANKDDAGE